MSGTTAVSSQASSNFNMYWDLADPNPQKRYLAAQKLIESLLQASNNAEGGAEGAEEPAKDSASKSRVYLRMKNASHQYAVNRLLNGLTSFNDCARQGFSLALSMCLAKLPFVNGNAVVEAIEALCKATDGGKSKQAENEGKDRHLARVFGYLALQRSGYFLQASCVGNLEQVVKGLFATYDGKPILREAAISVLSLILEDVASHNASVVVMMVSTRISGFLKYINQWQPLSKEQLSQHKLLNKYKHQSRSAAVQDSASRDRANESLGVIGGCEPALAALCFALLRFLPSKESSSLFKLCGAFIDAESAASMRVNKSNKGGPLRALAYSMVMGNMQQAPRLHVVWQSLFALAAKDSNQTSLCLALLDLTQQVVEKRDHLRHMEPARRLVRAVSADGCVVMLRGVAQLFFALAMNAESTCVEKLLAAGEDKKEKKLAVSACVDLITSVYSRVESYVQNIQPLMNAAFVLSSMQRNSQSRLAVGKALEELNHALTAVCDISSGRALSRRLRQLAPSTQHTDHLDARDMERLVKIMSSNDATELKESLASYRTQLEQQPKLMNNLKNTKNIEKAQQTALQTTLTVDHLSLIHKTDSVQLTNGVESLKLLGQVRVALLEQPKVANASTTKSFLAAVVDAFHALGFRSASRGMILMLTSALRLLSKNLLQVSEQVVANVTRHVKNLTLDSALHIAVDVQTLRLIPVLAAEQNDAQVAKIEALCLEGLGLVTAAKRFIVPLTESAKQREKQQIKAQRAEDRSNADEQSDEDMSDDDDDSEEEDNNNNNTNNVNDQNNKASSGFAHAFNSCLGAPAARTFVLGHAGRERMKWMAKQIARNVKNLSPENALAIIASVKETGKVLALNAGKIAEERRRAVEAARQESAELGLEMEGEEEDLQTEESRAESQQALATLAQKLMKKEVTGVSGVVIAVGALATALMGAMEEEQSKDAKARVGDMFVAELAGAFLELSGNEEEGSDVEEEEERDLKEALELALKAVDQLSNAQLSASLADAVSFILSDANVRLSDGLRATLEAAWAAVLAGAAGTDAQMTVVEELVEAVAVGFMNDAGDMKKAKKKLAEELDVDSEEEDLDGDDDDGEDMEDDDDEDLEVANDKSTRKNNDVEEENDSDSASDDDEDEEDEDLIHLGDMDTMATLLEEEDVPAKRQAADAKAVKIEAAQQRRENAARALRLLTLMDSLYSAETFTVLYALAKENNSASNTTAAAATTTNGKTNKKSKKQTQDATVAVANDSKNLFADLDNVVCSPEALAQKAVGALCLVRALHACLHVQQEVPKELKNLCDAAVGRLISLIKNCCAQVLTRESQVMDAVRASADSKELFEDILNQVESFVLKFPDTSRVKGEQRNQLLVATTKALSLVTTVERGTSRLVPVVGSILGDFVANRKTKVPAELLKTLSNMNTQLLAPNEQGSNPAIKQGAVFFLLKSGAAQSAYSTFTKREILNVCTEVLKFIGVAKTDTHHELVGLVEAFVEHCATVVQQLRAGRNTRGHHFSQTSAAEEAADETEFKAMSQASDQQKKRQAILLQSAMTKVQHKLKAMYPVENKKDNKKESKKE